MEQIEPSKIEEVETIVKIMDTMLVARPQFNMKLHTQKEIDKTFISCLGRLQDILKIKN